MSEDLEPNDPFADGLGAQMHATADHLGGAGVTRDGVAAAAVGRRRSVRTRSTTAAVAAAVVVLAGLAAVNAARRDDPDGERISTAAATTTEVPCPEVAPDLDDPMAWIRLTGPQAVVLSDGGNAAAGRRVALEAGQSYRLTYRELKELDEADQITGKQLFQMGYPDPSDAGLAVRLDELRGDQALSDDQRADLERRVFPVLTQGQVDESFGMFPDVLAIPLGGEPMDPGLQYEVPQYESDMLTPEQVQAIVEYERSLERAPDDATTTAPADPQSPTPFDEWVEILRDAGLLTAEQEAEVAAGGGLSLTPEQSDVIQEYWDSQAVLPPLVGSSTTTAPTAPSEGRPACGPGGDASTATTVPATTSSVPVATSHVEDATTSSTTSVVTTSSTSEVPPTTTTTPATTSTSELGDPVAPGS